MKRLSYLLLLTLLIFNNSCSKDNLEYENVQVTGVIKGTFEFDNYPVKGVACSIGASVSGISLPFAFTYTSENGTVSAETVFTESNPENSGKMHSFETYKDAYALGIIVAYFNLKDDSNFSYTITFEFKEKKYKKQVSPLFTGDEYIKIMYFFDTETLSIKESKI